MLKIFRIWSGVAALAFVAGETLTASPNKPLAVLLPYYVIGAWLLTGAVSRSRAPILFVSGWGVAFGYSYVAFADLLTVFQPPLFLLVLVGFTALVSLGSLGLAIKCMTPSPQQPSSRTGSKLDMLNVGSLLFAVLVVLFQVSTEWGQGKHLILRIFYLLIAGWLFWACLGGESRSKMLLAGWGVALGFFYAEFSGFLVFFERPAWLLWLAGTAAACSLVGVLVVSLNAKLPRPPGD